jgi:uncharacterized protein
MTPADSGTVAITGSSGLIGNALTASLRRDGIPVLRLVRNQARGPDEIEWRPGGELEPGVLAGVRAVVNLAGAPVADQRWNARTKDLIRTSRTDATRTIATAVARMDEPAVLVSQSAIGFYGQTGLKEVDESASKGSGYFSDVVAEWEDAAQPARDAGVRVVHPRTGIVLTRHGGALKRMVPLFRAGLGGRLGNGRQYWTWISMRDTVDGLRYLMEGSLAGPVNLVSPNACTNAEITKALARELHRPALLPAPAFALKLVIGEFSSEVLNSIRAAPARLVESGFTWRDPTISDALKAALAGW